MRRRIEIGLLYSRSGTYAAMAEACLRGALAGIAAVNADPALDLSLIPVARDPGGNIDRYAPLCDDILQSSTARHVIGCVTSWSRKEVIPTVEASAATLWYTVPYEGFEASDHVAYLHACPNQHLLPLLEHAFRSWGRRIYLVGSNYIWAWELGRLARETVDGAGGAVRGDRYLPMGATDVGRIIAEIRATRPDFILNSLIGPSSRAFMAAYRALGVQDAHFTPARCPVLSCNLTECELDAFGADAEGMVAAGPYFRGAAPGWPVLAGEAEFGSSFEAASFAAVRELARLLHGRPGAEVWPLARLLAETDDSMIDRKTHHTALPVRIARVEGGVFRVMSDLPVVAGDPYLTHPRQRDAGPALRVVS